jgi:hypothetical protein
VLGFESESYVGKVQNNIMRAGKREMFMKEVARVCPKKISEPLARDAMRERKDMTPDLRYDAKGSGQRATRLRTYHFLLMVRAGGACG